MIMPADAPQLAYLSKGGETLRVTASPNPESKIQNLKSKGRAGMQYRDLIPDRLGGLLIASHIRISDGGEVADYVHYHKLLFQMIYCKEGWVRVVYEDQGEPFVMNAGDFVLQPPQIRHRVLDASPGAEVIEVSSPAVHETWVDHETTLPNSIEVLDRDFGGQRFVRHVAADATWEDENGSVFRDLGISGATGGAADARVLRLKKGDDMRLPEAATSFLFVLDGELVGDQLLIGKNDSIVTGGHAARMTRATATCETELLHVSLSEEMDHLFLASSVPTDFEP